MAIVELMQLPVEEDHVAWLVIVDYGSSFDTLFKQFSL